MRNFSAEVQAALNQDLVKYNVLVRMDLNTSYFLTDSPYPVTYQGNIYSPDGGLIGYDVPRYTTITDREIYKISVIDHADQIQAEARAGCIGRRVTVYGVLEDPSGVLLLNPSDVIIVYKGFVDRVQISTNDEEKIAVLECASPLAPLDAVRPFLASMDGMDQINPLDTSFDQIYDDNEIKLKWGKV
jgi:hypothetical protein